MKTTVKVSSAIKRSARVMQVEGIFDVPPTTRAELSWEVNLPIEERPWNVGLIVGPSGCGKSTVGRNLFGAELNRFDHLRTMFAPGQSLLDGFPSSMGVKEIVALLSSVGFSSPPSWVRPFEVLSNGEQFRVMMARVLADANDGRIAVVDEFTSVVDRTVAQVGSAAISKAVRRNNQQLIAITCHEDVEAWLQPEWVYRPAEQSFAWRSVQPRPSVKLSVYRVKHDVWKRFQRHHYLSHEINKSAYCFAAFAEFPEGGRRLVAFDAWLPFFGKLKDARGGRRGHRTVCLPDFQGIGIGNALFSFLASMWAGLGMRAFSCTAHPAEIASRKRNPNWKMTRAPSMTARDTGSRPQSAGFAKSRAADRLTAGFEWVGPAMPSAQAERVLNNWTTRL